MNTIFEVFLELQELQPWLQDSETLELNDPETRRRMDADPMFRVEKTLRLGTRGWLEPVLFGDGETSGSSSGGSGFRSHDHFET